MSNIASFHLVGRYYDLSVDSDVPTKLQIEFDSSPFNKKFEAWVKRRVKCETF